MYHYCNFTLRSFSLILFPFLFSLPFRVKSFIQKINTKAPRELNWLPPIKLITSHHQPSPAITPPQTTSVPASCHHHPSLPFISHLSLSPPIHPHHHLFLPITTHSSISPHHNYFSHHYPFLPPPPIAPYHYPLYEYFITVHSSLSLTIPHYNSALPITTHSPFSSSPPIPNYHHPFLLITTHSSPTTPITNLHNSSLVFPHLHLPIINNHSSITPPHHHPSLITTHHSPITTHHRPHT